MSADRFTIEAGGHHLECAWHGPHPERAPTIVLLHEGLGSVAAWRTFPAELVRAAGCGVFVYSRWGYGDSDPRPAPWPLDYMEAEAAIVPAVLDAARVKDCVLVGHSDGGSIAIMARDPRVRGLALLAPHVFVEDVSVASIAKAKDAFRHTDLRKRLGKFHGQNVDHAFWGWNRAWLDPAFKSWNIESHLAAITVPTLVIQGDADPYGTLAQVDAIERGVRGPFERLVLAGVGHAPWREQPEPTISAINAHARVCLVTRGART
ncbi:MAG TPA: alpha/beta hydrolase [Kofleriaceae bacterium]|nr:alpha/beta hydrolase [Kofleriaceae bacterium]